MGGYLSVVELLRTPTRLPQHIIYYMTNLTKICYNVKVGRRSSSLHIDDDKLASYSFFVSFLYSCVISFFNRGKRISPSSVMYDATDLLTLVEPDDSP